MAHIFKFPSEAQKGILVFTHKEMRYVQGRVKRSFGRFSIKNIMYLVKKTIAMYRSKKMERTIHKLRDDYFIGVHWGMHAQDVKSPAWVDFHMATPGTATFLDNPFVIPLTSSNFTPLIMQPKKVDKYWDIICVAKNDNKKKYRELLVSIRKIYDAGFNYKVLLVIASNFNENPRDYYSSILKDYFSMFSALEREAFTIVKTDPELGFQGFSYSFISHLYNSSKIFTLFSQREGHAKVIKEAQLCGMPIVVKNDLQGGGRDYLDERNSFTFESYETAHESLIYAVENYEGFEVDYEGLAKNLREDHSVQLLREWFGQLYLAHGLCFDGGLVNLDNLNRRLPAHYFDKTIYWSCGAEYRFKTTDILSTKQFCSFINGLGRASDSCEKI